MLNGITYTPALEAEAAPILPPTFPPQVRWLALVMGVRLRAQRQTLEHHGYTGTASLNKEAAPVSISGQKGRFLRLIKESLKMRERDVRRTRTKWVRETCVSSVGCQRVDTPSLNKPRSLSLKKTAGPVSITAQNSRP
jgi:hypothetical protein